MSPELTQAGTSLITLSEQEHEICYGLQDQAPKPAPLTFRGAVDLPDDPDSQRDFLSSRREVYSLPGGRDSKV